MSSCTTRHKVLKIGHQCLLRNSLPSYRFDDIEWYEKEMKAGEVSATKATSWGGAARATSAVISWQWLACDLT